MKNYLLACLMAFFSVSIVFAQESIVSGKVTDSETGEPLPGVNVMIQGTTMGSVTDLDGNYATEVPEAAVLMFSYVGYKTQLVEVGNQTTINVALLPDVTALSEVVVVGYGTQEKKEITSAVASVKAEDFNMGNVNDAAQLIQGKVAGLSISRPGGNPNQGYNIRLRGLPTVGASTQPLVVIDGVVGGTLDNVDPTDIESIDVLKDGSAAAIYGTRGSAGVILVTTKTGSEGVFNIDYIVYGAMDNVARTPDVMSASEWRDLSNEVGLGTDFQNDTDWFDEITNTAFSQVHNLAVSGGTKQTSYRASINYRDIDGIMINTGRQQLNGRLNLQQKAVRDKLTFTLNFAGAYIDRKMGFDQAARYATVYNPTAPVRVDENTPLPSGYDRDLFTQWGGYFNQVLFDFYNPVQILEQNVNDEKQTRINLAGRLAYEIIEGLTVDGFYSLQTETDLIGRYYSKQSFWVGMDDNGFARREERQRYNQLFETTARWNGDIGSNINLGALAGYSYQEFKTEEFGAEAGDFITDAFLYNNLGAAKQFDDGLGNVWSNKNSSKLIAFFGRVNLNINETWFVSASVRHEGSSRFGIDQKWGTFPAISGGVELANFLGSPSIDNLKFRASYGVTGQLPPDPYLSLLRFGPQGNFFYNGAWIPAYGPVSNSNPNLGWEQKGEFNLGFDFSFAGDKVYGAIDWYTRTTTDLIIEFGVPVPPNLFDRTNLNVGDIKNTGLELALSWAAVQKPNFSYTPSLTMSWYLKNEITSLSDEASGLEYGVRDIAGLGSPGQNETPLIRIEEGKPYGQIWGLMFDQVNTDGNWVFKDANGDGDAEGGNEDRAVIGSGVPDFEYGWNNVFTFGKLDFVVFFRGAVGHDLVNTYRAFYEVPNVVSSYNVIRTATDIKNEETGQLLSTSSGKFSDLHVENASFFRLDNFNLGYTIPIPESSAVKRLRVYLAGNNIFTITGYKGVDPEVRWADPGESGDVWPPNPLAPGIDRRNTWYTARSWSIGVQLGL